MASAACTNGWWSIERCLFEPHEQSLHEECMDQAGCDVPANLLATPADMSRADKLPGWRPGVAFQDGKQLEGGSVLAETGLVRGPL